MNGLQVFQNEQFGSVRTIDEDGKILFCGKDVASALGYQDPHKAIQRHCKGWGTKRPVGVETGTKSDGTPAIKNIEMLFITEGDLYRLITHSRLPAAEAFEKWVFDVVLPEIRMTGRYEPEPTKDYEEIEEPPAKELPYRTHSITNFSMRENRARMNWLNYMISVIGTELDMTNNQILHLIYKDLESNDININAIKAEFIRYTGLRDASTFEALADDRTTCSEMADILHQNMKNILIKRRLKHPN